MVIQLIGHKSESEGPEFWIKKASRMKIHRTCLNSTVSEAGSSAQWALLNASASRFAQEMTVLGRPFSSESEGRVPPAEWDPNPQYCVPLGIGGSHLNFVYAQPRFSDRKTCPVQYPPVKRKSLSQGSKWQIWTQHLTWQKGKTYSVLKLFL